MVEGAGQPDDPLAAELRERRFEPHHATRGGWDSDRPSRIGADRREGHSGRNRNGRPAARPAGHVSWDVRVTGRTKGRDLPGRPEGELVEIALADEDGARLSESRKRRRVGGRPHTGQHS